MKNLVRAFPVLRDRLPWVSLGQFPTPVERLSELEKRIGSKASLWIKRDDLSGSIYGSNKVRKLEFLLGDALQRGRNRVFAAGALGSIYAVASSLYARQVSLGCTCVLFPQPMAPRSHQNLRLILSLSDHVEIIPSVAFLPFAIGRALWRDRRREGVAPCRMPVGGSSPLGCLGLVDAVLELQAQIDEGRLPEPDYIVAANIPYYITSALLRQLLEARFPPRRVVLTVQKEVAQRICASAGSFSLLALSVQVYGEPSITHQIPAGAFYPPPKVDSAVVRIEIYPQPRIPRKQLDTFFALIKAGFAQKRKTLQNALSAGMLWDKEKTAGLLNAAGIDTMRRAQTLSLRESLHVRAAAQMGGGNWYIIRRHLMPEMFPLYLIGFAAKARIAMFMEAALAFLGLFDPSRKSLGMTIGYALKYYYLDIWWNWLLPPIACLSLLIMTVTFLAISLEKVLDPRLREALG